MLLRELPRPKFNVIKKERGRVVSVFLRDEVNANRPTFVSRQVGLVLLI
jgi:hypothetical protein